MTHEAGGGTLDRAGRREQGCAAGRAVYIRVAAAGHRPGRRRRHRSPTWHTWQRRMIRAPCGRPGRSKVTRDTDKPWTSSVTPDTIRTFVLISQRFTGVRPCGPGDLIPASSAHSVGTLSPSGSESTTTRIPIGSGCPGFVPIACACTGRKSGESCTDPFSLAPTSARVRLHPLVSSEASLELRAHRVSQRATEGALDLRSRRVLPCAHRSPGTGARYAR